MHCDRYHLARNGTEDGIIHEFVSAGISKDCIVLGFRSPEMRKYTDANFR
ncbi:MAG: element excision factor XisI family protein [Microcoleus sp.]